MIFSSDANFANRRRGKQSSSSDSGKMVFEIWNLFSESHFDFLVESYIESWRLQDTKRTKTFLNLNYCAQATVPHFNSWQLNCFSTLVMTVSVLVHLRTNPFSDLILTVFDKLDFRIAFSVRYLYRALITAPLHPVSVTLTVYSLKQFTQTLGSLQLLFNRQISLRFIHFCALLAAPASKHGFASPTIRYLAVLMLLNHVKHTASIKQEKPLLLSRRIWLYKSSCHSALVLSQIVPWATIVWVLFYLWSVLLAGSVACFPLQGWAGASKHVRR